MSLNEKKIKERELSEIRESDFPRKDELLSLLKGEKRDDSYFLISEALLFYGENDYFRLFRKLSDYSITLLKENELVILISQIVEIAKDNFSMRKKYHSFILKFIDIAYKIGKYDESDWFLLLDIARNYDCSAYQTREVLRKSFSKMDRKYAYRFYDWAVSAINCDKEYFLEKLPSLIKIITASKSSSFDLGALMILHNVERIKALKLIHHSVSDLEPKDYYCRQRVLDYFKNYYKGIDGLALYSYYKKKFKETEKRELNTIGVKRKKSWKRAIAWDGSLDGYELFSYYIIDNIKGKVSLDGGIEENVFIFNMKVKNGKNIETYNNIKIKKNDIVVLKRNGKLKIVKGLRDE